MLYREQDEKLSVAFAPCNRRLDGIYKLQPGFNARLYDLLYGLSLVDRILHNAPFSHTLPADFKLRLDERNAMPVRFQQRRDSGQNQRQRNERSIDRRQIHRLADIRWLEKTGIPFDRDHSRILAQP